MDRLGILEEVYFTTQRSQGAGGQHVNRTNSAVTLKWNYLDSRSIDDREKDLIEKKLSSRINEEGLFYLRRENHRHQILNKKEAKEELIRLLEKAFFRPKVRKPTRPTRGSVQDRLNDKKNRSEKKTLRSKKWNSDES
jgi:ribosome-associated protein